MSYNKAKNVIDSHIYDYVHKMLLNGGFLIRTLSEYASKGFSKHSYTEIIAESFSVRETNNIEVELLNLLGDD